MGSRLRLPIRRQSRTRCLLDTGFSSAGPYSGLPGYEGIIAAKAGLFPAPNPFRPGPVFINSNLGGSAAAHLALGGSIAALMVRNRTGVGQHVEASLWQGTTCFDYWHTPYVQYLLNRFRDAGAPDDAIGNAGRETINRTVLRACSKTAAGSTFRTSWRTRPTR